MNGPLNALLFGASAMAALVASLFFLRFWRNTRDRFFLFFAVAFLIDAVTRVVLGLSVFPKESEPLFYVARLLSFAIIIAAIVDKNRK
ncbi:MAG TPA: DUF5985 family protein [Candidatus Krumholzibacteria bacterium]|nr:DUF5985 family protein [Candidatus Krumholzibacteria bacterium]